jgi:hypothetical protein
MLGWHVGRNVARIWASKWKWLFLLCGCLAAGALSFAIAFVAYSPATRVRAAQSARPFTASVRTEYYFPTGDLASSVVREYARFSDRTMISRVREEFPTHSELPWEIFDLRNERKLIVDPSTKSIITRGYGRQELLSNITNMEDESCPDNLESLPRGEAYLGYRTRFIKTHEDPDTDQERWIVPELECFPVKSVVRRGSAHNEVNAISLNEGEPSRDLAFVPPDYAERSPSEIEEIYSKSMGKPLFGALTRRLEADYQKRRVRPSR